ncbi:class I SAM-dependent DNA methyltransferase [Halorussus salinisoli]|uniref:class I SAM-dependent DNA methyltransferase n=1 Tax=Halorussus salinisoli TaxID=2558242 RepID=UPI0010C21380|nr:class I SAM-dependent methyltransferase [Halorussus salinisoli]
MTENLYSEYPEAYDALYAEKDYDAEVEFVLSEFEAAAESTPDQRRALVLGCGTGEHGKRLRAEGFDVVGVDKYPAMVERARTKTDAEFRVGELPDLPVEESFDLVWFPFTVVQHLDPDAVADSLRAAADRLAEGGVLVFDQISGEDFGDSASLRTYPSEDGTYARLTHVHEADDGASRYDALVFTPDGEFFVDTHRLFDHDDSYLEGVCNVLDLSVERFGWYDEEADPDETGHVVYVAQ